MKADDEILQVCTDVWVKKDFLREKHDKKREVFSQNELCKVIKFFSVCKS